MPEPRSCVDAAKAYLDASNRHDLNDISDLLSADCRYFSSGAGEHNGRDAILDMMRGFFAQYPNVRWEARNLEAETVSTAAFDFTIFLPSGAFEGREWVAMNETGLISEIRVER
ncbi:MAG: nuclear transport factor 2 family protein [Pseudomonadota bacterium]